MGKNDDSQRCGGCGKPFEDGQKAKEVLDGKMTETRRGLKFEAVKSQMKLHEHCFNHAVDSPEVALKEIRKLSAGPRPAARVRAVSA